MIGVRHDVTLKIIILIEPSFNQFSLLTIFTFDKFVHTFKILFLYYFGHSLWILMLEYLLTYLFYSSKHLPRPSGNVCSSEA